MVWVNVIKVIFGGDKYHFSPGRLSFMLMVCLPPGFVNLAGITSRNMPSFYHFHLTHTVSSYQHPVDGTRLPLHTPTGALFGGKHE